MDPNYAMAKFGLESKDRLKFKQRDCWYYTKYFFFFLSIIQFLIILGLVLFMLYGNAHVGTELRLKSVETRYSDYVIKYNLLNLNYSQLKIKVASLEKENLNCSNLLTTALKEMKNRTCGRPPPFIPFQESCRNYQFSLDRLNTSYIIDTLQLKHQILLLQRDYDRLNEKCDQTNASLANKLNTISSEIEKVQGEKKGLETQIKIQQSVCTDINNRFHSELERMKSRLEGIISAANEPLQHSKCWSISNEIKNAVDITVGRLRQDVNNVMFENSRMKTDNTQLTENLQKCHREKDVFESEKNNLLREKGGLEIQLSEKKENLAKFSLTYLKKEEELQNCRKMQLVQRAPSVSLPRS